MNERMELLATDELTVAGAVTHSYGWLIHTSLRLVCPGRIQDKTLVTRVDYLTSFLFVQRKV